MPNELVNEADFFGLALFWVLEDDVVNFSGEYHSGRQSWSRTLRDWGEGGSKLTDLVVDGAIEYT